MATQPVEDIDAVLGRFQAWAGARTATETKLGIREIPYEEALASDRYRWKGVGTGGSQSEMKPESVAVEEPKRRKSEPDGKRRTAKKVRARGHGRAVAESAEISSRAKTRTSKSSSSDVKAATEAAPVTGRISTEAKGGGGNHCAAKSGRRGRSKAAKPEFREALAEAVKPAEVVTAQPVDLARQAAISIRLAAAERSLIQERASEAGTTVSAYMRQCALEVEQMREQVRQAVAALEQGAPAASMVGPAPKAGFFARMARRFFPRRAQVLALRA